MDEGRQERPKIIPIDRLLEGYMTGVFPMSRSRYSNDYDWYTAKRRGIIPINQFHISKNVERLIRQGRFDVRFNTHFSDVMQACADRSSTWISDIIIESYVRLHELDFAHSVEIWKNNELVGGLYGVAIGGAFFGESMFHYETDMDKIALHYCHQRLSKGEFKLWDTQFYTDHLSQFGCIEISSDEYIKKLHAALKVKAHFIHPDPDQSL